MTYKKVFLRCQKVGGHGPSALFPLLESPGKYRRLDIYGQSINYCYSKLHLR